MLLAEIVYSKKLPLEIIPKEQEVINISNFKAKDYVGSINFEFKLTSK